MLPEIETILTPPSAVSEPNIPEGLSHIGKKTTTEIPIWCARTILT